MYNGKSKGSDHIMMADKIKILLIRKGLNLVQLADLLHTSQSNLSNKFKRDNFSEKDLQEIATATGCKVKIDFYDLETDEKLS